MGGASMPQPQANLIGGPHDGVTIDWRGRDVIQLPADLTFYDENEATKDVHRYRRAAGEADYHYEGVVQI